jgi:CRISPR-associated protein Csy2
MSYLFLPNIRSQSANAMAGQYAITPAQVMAFVMFAHALGRQAGFEAQRVAVLHHDAHLLGEHGGKFYDFRPHQRRGAAFIDGADYSSKNKNALSLQPVATCHLTVSMLIETDRLPSRDRVQDFLLSARLAGGTVTNAERVGAKLQSAAMLDEIALPKGSWIVERSDLMRAGGSPVESVVQAIGARVRRKRDSAAEDATPEPDLSWLSLAVLGYAAITNFERRVGVRQTDEGETPLHAYAEPLLGLVQYVPSRNLQEIPFWEPRWIRDDVFVVTQSKRMESLK